MARRTRSRQPSLVKKVQIAENIRITEAQHEELLNYITARLEFGKKMRDGRAEIYTAIDRFLNGNIILDEDDKKRVRDNLKGRGVKPVDFNAQFVLSHLADIAGYVMDLIFPTEGMYQALSGADTQDAAQALARRMNKDAAFFDHYNAALKSVMNMLKYNLGGVMVEWYQHQGKMPKLDEARRQVEFVDAILWEGNALPCIDPYNFLYDESKEPEKLYTHGEFAATVRIKTEFEIQQMINNNEIFSSNRFIRGAVRSGTYKSKTVGSDLSSTYYYTRPDISRQALTLQQSGYNANKWDQVFSYGQARTNDMNAFEVVDVYIHLSPQKFGLSTEKKMQIWRFTIIGSEYIVQAQLQDSMHQCLPFLLASPVNDGFAQQSKSIAETLLPFQLFMSHELNTHQRALRRALNGITIYDERVVPDPRAIDLSGGFIPVRPSGANPNVNNHVKSLDIGNMKTDTERNIGLAVSLMDSIHPVVKPQMVADLQRATQYQAAQLNQTSTRKSFQLGKSIHAMCFEPAKRLQYYNLVQYGKPVDMIDENGQKIMFNPVQIVEAQIEFDISAGLKGIDRLMMISTYTELVMTILQSPQVANGSIDIIGLIDYVTTLHGDKTSFKQFKAPSPLTNMPPQMQQLAFSLLQQFMQTEQGQAAVQQIEAGGTPAGPAQGV